LTLIRYPSAIELLAFSDLHNDLDAAARLVELSAAADVVIGAGDFASQHHGLEQTIEALSGIEKPVIVVPGNNETEEALRQACAGWESATVLHGGGAEIDGVSFYGLGAGVPVTPWDWSFDLTDEQAGEMLADCPEGAVLVLHSPPKGHCDSDSAGQSLGSEALLEAIEAKRPPLAVCGHIHDSWGQESKVGPTDIINLGPAGRMIGV
jgi:Icc-related predicted phosphoesterase